MSVNPPAHPSFSEKNKYILLYDCQIDVKRTYDYEKLQLSNQIKTFILMHILNLSLFKYILESNYLGIHTYSLLPA